MLQLLLERPFLLRLEKNDEIPIVLKPNPYFCTLIAVHIDLLDSKHFLTLITWE